MDRQLVAEINGYGSTKNGWIVITLLNKLRHTILDGSILIISAVERSHLCGLALPPPRCSVLLLCSVNFKKPHDRHKLNGSAIRV